MDQATDAIGAGKFVVIIAIVVGILAIKLLLNSRIHLMAKILCLAFIAEQLFSDYDFGPVSMRIYLVGFVFAITIFTLCRRRFADIPRITISLAACYLLLAVWFAVAGLVNGADVSKSASTIILGVGLNLAVFLSVHTWMKKADDRRALLICMAAITTLSASFAVMQWLNVDWAWQTIYSLRAGASSRDVMLGLKGGGGIIQEHEAASWVPGLTLFSVTLNSQQMVFGGVALAAMLFARGIGWFMRAGLLLIVSTGYLAIYISQQRSGIILFPIACLGAILLAARTEEKKRFANKGLMFRIVSTVLAISLCIFALIKWSAGQDLVASASGQGGYELNRMNHFTVSKRLDIARIAWGVGLRNPGFGNPDEYNFTVVNVLQFHSSPHNYFLHSIALYGVPALLIAIAFLFFWARLSQAALVCVKGEHPERWTAVACVLGLLAYALNMQLHSISPLVNDTASAWLLGILSALVTEPLKVRRNATL